MNQPSYLHIQFTFSNLRVHELQGVPSFDILHVTGEPYTGYVAAYVVRQAVDEFHTGTKVDHQERIRLTWVERNCRVCGSRSKNVMMDPLYGM